MSTQFLAEIRIFPFNFAPRGWAFCDGQLLPISQNTALFSLLGTYYGGDGKSTFALPNLQGSAPLEQGQGPGLSLYDLGQAGGSDMVTLITSEIPSHNHAFNADPAAATTANPANAAYAQGQWTALPNSGSVNMYYVGGSNPPNATLAPTAIGPNPGGQPHNNLMPYLTLNFCIALQGIFPPRP
jgi:microcystin-dependent protein